MAIALWSATRSMTSRARSLNSVIVNDSTASRLSSRCVRPIGSSVIKTRRYYTYFSYEKYETHQSFDNRVAMRVLTDHCAMLANPDLHGLRRSTRRDATWLD